MNVNPYAHPQPEKALKHLLYVWRVHGMQFERFYSLNQSVLAWFAHLHQVGFQPTFLNLGKCLWWVRCQCEAICPSSSWEDAITPHIGMPLTWDYVWKILQPQPKRSGMVWTLTSGRISANSHKSWEASVVIMVWIWSHMPIHNLKRRPNLSYMYGMDIECTSKGSTASIKKQWHGFYTSNR